jgi:hypothetical protein
MNPIASPYYTRLLVFSGMVSMIAFGDVAVTKPVMLPVSDVALADKPLEAGPASEILRRGAGDEVEAFSPVDGQEWIAPMQSIGHPFIAAAHRAFADHRPLALSPDMIWLLLVQMAAEEVHAAPEKYRALFADHEHGSRTMEVRRDEFVLGAPQNDWPGVFSELEGKIVAKVPVSPAADFSHAFSTSTPTEIAARRVVLLKAASAYYNYQVGTLCGIPRIELHGTADDWRWIRERVAGLRKFNMERRVKALTPVLDECVAAAEGKANSAFWKSFYKYASESGSSYVSGWINTFFIKENDESLDGVLDPKFSWIAPPEQKGRDGAANFPLAITTSDYSSKGVVDVDFIWDHLGKTFPMRWRAGFMGVAQDRKSMTLKPVIAWQVLRAKLSSEERKAADYLGSLGNIDWFTMRSIKRGLSLDPATGFIRDVRPKLGGPLDGPFWKKAFPMMARLETLSVGALFREAVNRAEHKAICEAMLSAPAVKVVVVPKSLDAEFLRILQERKDWKVEVESEK